MFVEHDLIGSVFGEGEALENSALIVLNSGSFSSRLLECAWRRCPVRVCADGGANRLFDLLDQSQLYIPAAVVGDLDSVRPEVVAFYRTAGVVLEAVEDQDRNDFEKALDTATALCVARRDSRAPAGAGLSIVVLGAFGGRFDQEMACFNAAHRFVAATGGRITLYSDENVATILSPGVVHRLEVRPALGEGPHCGLIPLGGRCESVTTTGLRWNLSRQPLAFGELVSSSNLVDAACDAPSATVTIETSHPLVWTISHSAAER